AAAAAAALIAVPAEAAPDESLAMGRYIVVLEDGVAHPGMVARAQATGLGADIGHVYKHALSGYSAVLPTTQVAELRADPRVASVTPDRPVHAAAQTTPTGVDRIEGDLSSTVSGNGSGSVNVGVAVIDTGIDLQHTDLNVVGGTNCDLPILPPDDDNGHGTHVAGTIAAEDNGQDVVGMAPGARLYAVKVLNAAGVGFTSNVVCGIDWVAANAQALNIKVANMSLGGGGEDDGNCGRTNDDPEHTAICDAVAQGVTFAVAAGNDNANFNGFTPAAYDEVLTTTAIADFNGQPGGGAASTCRSDVDDTAASFSNFTTVGSADVGHTIAAPGTCILSTRSGGGTTTFSGTSMASPHMAGTAALCIAGPCAGMSPAQVIDKLRNDAAAQPASYGFTDDPRTPNGNRYYGHLAHAGGY
ncbi:MAG: S8 family serine peptidase, partial [Streptomycetales bacterium]